MNILRRIVVILLVATFCFLLTASAAPDIAPAGIDVIWAYAGSWKVEIEHLDTAQSKASHEVTTLRNACWKDGGYLACNQYVDGESKVLIVFTYNPGDKTYTSYQIPPGGGNSGWESLSSKGTSGRFHGRSVKLARRPIIAS